MHWTIISPKEPKPAYLYASTQSPPGMNAWYTVEEKRDAKFSVVKHIEFRQDIGDVAAAMAIAEADSKASGNS